MGYGRVGSRVGQALQQQGVPLNVIDDNDDVVQELAQQGVEAISGSAVTVLPAANLAQAKCLIVAIPDAIEAGQIVAQARAGNEDLRIITRSHSEAEALHLKECGASVVVLGAEEIADGILTRFGRPAATA